MKKNRKKIRISKFKVGSLVSLNCIPEDVCIVLYTLDNCVTVFDFTDGATRTYMDYSVSFYMGKIELINKEVSL